MIYYFIILLFSHFCSCKGNDCFQSSPLTIFMCRTSVLHFLWEVEDDVHELIIRFSEMCHCMQYSSDPHGGITLHNFIPLKVCPLVVHSPSGVTG